jgi:hypothetical protein
MTINEIKPESGLNFASSISGVIFSLMTAIIFMVIYGSETTVAVENLKDNFNFINISIILLAFFVGFFIQGIRYVGFNYYTYLYNKNDISKSKDLICPKGIVCRQKASPYQRIIFYIFRNGTTVEECLSNVRAKYYVYNEAYDKCKEEKKKKNCSIKKSLKKQYRPYYGWIQESKQPAKDLWIYSNKINNAAPQENIFRFYHWSEAYQCMDTTFLLSCMVFLLIFFVNCSLFIISYSFNKSCHISIVLPIVFSIISWLFHILAKACSKAYANRFFNHIDFGIKVIKCLEHKDGTNDNTPQI